MYVVDFRVHPEENGEKFNVMINLSLLIQTRISIRHFFSGCSKNGRYWTKIVLFDFVLEKSWFWVPFFLSFSNLYKPILDIFDLQPSTLVTSA